MPRPAKILGMPREEFEQLEQHPCERCQAPGPNHPQRDKQVLCHGCITAIHAEIDAQRRQARANRPKCEGCRRRPSTRDLLCTDRRVGLCGTCRNTVNRKIHTIAIYGPPRATSADVFAALAEATTRSTR